MSERVTVTELNTRVKELFGSTPGLKDIWVIGEISNFKLYTSGHSYFTIKDAGSEIRAVMFKSARARIDFEPGDSQKIEAYGHLDMYVERGSYQFIVESMKRSGIGDLYLKYEALKKKLEAEGLFESARKRPLPQYPKTIGVVTSPTGAVIHDILTTTKRLFPADILLAPAQVQGEGAAKSIVAGIELLNRQGVDVIIVGRGGGSLEDLWAFNEEPVVRAIAASKVPVISSVGHETDFTIADFAADVRSPTPTGAAELVSRSRDDWMDALSVVAGQMMRLIDRQLQQAMLHTDMLSRRLVSPAAYIQRERLRLKALAVRLSSRQPDIRTMGYQLGRRTERLVSAIRNALSGRQQKVVSLSAQLELLNPQRILDRGYAIMQDEHGRVVRSPADIPVKRPVSVRLADGSADIVVDSVQPTLS